jgi:uncharacterized protein (TIGR00255 family)
MPLRSMTGFSRFQREDGNWVQIWEIRSVNSRYLDPKWRLPVQARGMEARLEKVLRRHAARGRVEVTLALRSACAVAPAVFAAPQATAMLRILDDFARSRGHAFQPDYTALLSLPHLWNSETPEEEDDWARSLEAGLASALGCWNAARLREGADLAHDLSARFRLMKQWLALITERAPAIKEERFAQVRERLAETLAALGGELDEGRFLQEMVILADRLDVSEELTRLRSHLARLGELLENGEDAGRKLDFTLQECFREINTCGNKIQDGEISRLVVEFKNELEKCREQAQNVE